MSIVRLCPYAKDEHCKYEIYYGEPLFSKCKNCEIKIVADMKQRKDVHKTFNNEVEKMTIQGVDMFEKEAEEYQIRKHHQRLYGHKPVVMKELNTTYKDGAEFGYNKANEWHYVKDGDLPKENEYIMIYSKLADNIAVGKRRCAGKIRKRCVYEWYFATYEGTYCLKDKDIIAWKEIELPKEIKEND